MKPAYMKISHLTHTVDNLKKNDILDDDDFIPL